MIWEPRALFGDQAQMKRKSGKNRKVEIMIKLAGVPLPQATVDSPRSTKSSLKTERSQVQKMVEVGKGAIRPVFLPSRTYGTRK